MRVDHYLRDASSEWKLRSYSTPDEKIEIASLGCELLLSDVYEQVEFPRASHLRGATEE
jgi:hypothetical protein